MKKFHVVSLLALFMASGALAGTDTVSTDTNGANKVSSPIGFDWNMPTFSSWWNGKSGTADWLGLAKPLNDCGLTVRGELKYVYFGEVMGGFPGGNQSRSDFIPEVKLKFLYDFAKIFGIEGLTIQSNWRYRNVAGNNPGYEADTTGVTSGWNPTDMSSGFGLRMLQQYLEYSTKNKSLTINLGLEDPYEQFLQQPLSKLFENNMIASSKGIGATAGPGIPVNSTAPNTAPRLFGAPGVTWSSTYLAWGGTLRVQPSRSTYLQAGLYEAIAGANGVSPSQYTMTSVYPYTTIPQSYAGTMKYSGQIVPVVDSAGLATGKYQNIGWVPAYQNNHGFTTGGAAKNNFNTGTINVKAPAYKTSAYGAVSYSGVTYNQNGVGGNWSGNGLFNTYELGWTPKLGPDKLEGKYAIGSYIWSLPNYSYNTTSYQYVAVNSKGQTVVATNPKPFPTSYNGLSAGLYLQADQMLFRQKSAAEPPSTASGKDVKSPEAPVSAKVSDRGLYSFNEANFTSPYYNAMPFYFQTGLVYKGLLDCRPADQFGVALGAGFYSTYLNQWQNTQNQASSGTSTFAVSKPTAQYLPSYTSTEVLECFYAFRVNKWAYVKPYAQWLYNPAGNGTMGTDLTLGARLSVVF